MESFNGSFITVITGPMFAGKTGELTRTTRRLSLAGKKGIVFKPAKDTRFGAGYVTTHDGDKTPAVVVGSVRDIRSYIDDHDVASFNFIAVDEAQFLETDELLILARELTGRGIMVVIAILDKKWDGTPFDGVGALLAESDVIKRLHAICVHCKGLASHSYRKVADQGEILVGGSEAYEALCRSCFNKAMAERA